MALYEPPHLDLHCFNAAFSVSSTANFYVFVNKEDLIKLVNEAV